MHISLCGFLAFKLIKKLSPSSENSTTPFGLLLGVFRKRSWDDGEIKLLDFCRLQDLHKRLPTLGWACWAAVVQLALTRRNPFKESDSNAYPHGDSKLPIPNTGLNTSLPWQFRARWTASLSPCRLCQLFYQREHDF